MIYIHPIDPHYSHDFADLYFSGKRFCLTKSKEQPITPLEMIQTFATEAAAIRFLQGAKPLA